MAKRISLYVSEEVWRDFRVACVKRNTSASREIERLMKEQLDKWEDNQDKGNK